MSRATLYKTNKKGIAVWRIEQEVKKNCMLAGMNVTNHRKLNDNEKSNNKD